MHADRKQGVLVGLAIDVNLLGIGPNVWIVVEVGHRDPNLVASANVHPLTVRTSCRSVGARNSRKTGCLKADAWFACFSSHKQENQPSNVWDCLPLDQVSGLPTNT